MASRTTLSKGFFLPVAVLAFGGSINVCLGQTNVLTYRNDQFRTGQNLTERALTPNNVRPSTFGRLFTVPVDGKVDAQPLYVSSVNIGGQNGRPVVYAATEHDSVYAFDAANGHVYWHTMLLNPGETSSDDRGCSQVYPELGATATPVIDLSAGAHGTIYLVATSQDGSHNSHQRLHALDIATGAEEFGGPTEVAASYPGSGDNSSNGRVVFDPKQYKSRPGLTLVNGTVYTAWGSHCDFRPYTGWLIGYDRLTLNQNSVFNFAPNGSEGSIWAAGGGVSADSAGNLFIELANGTFDTALNTQGFPSKGDYGNAFIKLTRSGGQLVAVDYWTMHDTVMESSRDLDLGSGGLMLLPDMKDANGNTRHLATGAGKDANIYVFDRDNMGKFNANNFTDSNLYQRLPGALGGSEFASPAWFNGTVYYGAVNNVIRAYKMNAARLGSQPSSTTSTAFGYPGATPAISANGTSNGILWAVENTNPAVLHAYDANNLADELYNSNQAGSGRDQFGPGNKYITPTIADGRVFVGTTNSVAVFGLTSVNQGSLPDGNYSVTNQASSLALDDPGYSKISGQQIIQWSGNGGPNQKWHFARQANGYYTIQNVWSGLFLTDPGGTSAQGVGLQQQVARNDDSQLWSLIPSGASFVILNKAGNLAIDDPAYSGSAGTAMILWGDNGGGNQQWAVQ